MRVSYNILQHPMGKSGGPRFPHLDVVRCCKTLAFLWCLTNAFVVRCCKTFVFLCIFIIGLQDPRMSVYIYKARRRRPPDLHKTARTPSPPHKNQGGSKTSQTRIWFFQPRPHGPYGQLSLGHMLAAQMIQVGPVGPTGPVIV